MIWTIHEIPLPDIQACQHQMGQLSVIEKNDGVIFLKDINLLYKAGGNWAIFSSYFILKLGFEWGNWFRDSLQACWQSVSSLTDHTLTLLTYETE